MTFDPMHLIPVAPELFLLTAACAILVIDLFLKGEQREITYILAQFALIGTAALALLVGGGERQVVFSGSVIRDEMTDLLKASIAVIAFGAFLYAKEYLKDRNLFKGEFYTLGMFAVTGMLIMVSAGDFLTVYLGLELLSLSLYALVAFDRESGKGSEAAMKYFVLGAIASGMLLYGISMIYGATGAIDFPGIAKALASGEVNETIMVFGTVFVVIGLAFKFGAVPFHMWAPDVYEGSPTAVTMIIASAPKIAAVAMAIRILDEGLGGINTDWQGMLVILAVLSMGLGNLVAIAQSNIKRMLAYSTISHVGFIFLGLLAGSQSGYASAMFYAITYALTALGAFGIIILLSRKGFEADQLDDFRGLNQRSPWFAAMMLLMMFSMAGVPPTVGFFAKLFVLEAVIRIDLTWLALVAVFFSVIGAFYYLRIVKLMYFDKPADSTPLSAGFDTQLALSVNGLAVLALGIYPTGLMAWCLAAAA
jgi:NADH-quinone oxidoreductase subunit N